MSYKIICTILLIAIAAVPAYPYSNDIESNLKNSSEIEPATDSPTTAALNYVNAALEGDLDYLKAHSTGVRLAWLNNNPRAIDKIKNLYPQLDLEKPYLWHETVKGDKAKVYLSYFIKNKYQKYKMAPTFVYENEIWKHE